VSRSACGRRAASRVSAPGGAGPSSGHSAQCPGFPGGVAGRGPVWDMPSTATRRCPTPFAASPTSRSNGRSRRSRRSRSTTSRPRCTTVGSEPRSCAACFVSSGPRWARPTAPRTRRSATPGANCQPSATLMPLSPRSTLSWRPHSTACRRAASAPCARASSRTQTGPATSGTGGSGPRARLTCSGRAAGMPAAPNSTSRGGRGWTRPREDLPGRPPRAGRGPPRSGLRAHGDA
jgi:hypothetical protein